MAAVAPSPDRTRLATVTADGIVRVWGTPPPPATYPQRGAQRSVFHPDGRHLLLVGDAVQLWDLAARTSRTLATNGQVYDAAFSSDGWRIVTASRAPAARIWDVQNGAEVMSLEHGRYVQQASFSRDG